MADTGLTVWAAGFWPDDFWAAGFWAQGDAPPEPEVVAQTPAGRPKRHYYVEVDGQQFPVNNATEALQILQKARALAERQAEEEAKLAEKRVKRAIKKRGSDVPQIRVPTPSIKVSPEFKADTAALIADIDRLYKQAAMNAEMRMLLAKKQADDDEEDDLMLLL